MKLTYHCCGDYLLPALTIPDESVTLGKYGRMRKTYLKEHKPILYKCPAAFRQTDGTPYRRGGRVPGTP